MVLKMGLKSYFDEIFSSQENYYDVIFHSQYVRSTNGRKVASGTASVLVSFLKFLDKIRSCSNPDNDENIQKEIDCAEELLQRLSNLEGGRPFPQAECILSRQILGGSLEAFREFGDFVYDRNAFFTQEAMIICRDVIRCDVDSGVSERYYVDSTHYDEQFKLRADNIGFEIVEEPHGVYTLLQPYP